MKNFFLSFFLLLISSANFIYAESINIGLGSCLDQDYPQPIWQSIKKEDLNYFIFLGDNVYGDTPSGSLRKMKSAYDKQKKVLPDFLNDISIFSIWDDHDFGINDGGADYRFKRQAQELYIDFWEIPKEDDRSNRDGIYFSKNKIFFDKKFKFIFLDTRFFRSKLKGKKSNYIENIDPNATILGDAQWMWLENELKNDFDFLFIFSSIQIIAKDHRFEKWSNFPNERVKLFELLEKFNDKTIFFSGDRHRAGIYKKNGIIEVTSSSMNKPGSFSNETDSYLLGKTYPQENYSVLKIFENTIQIKIKDVNGIELESVVHKY
ncbi:alkaline phosphatase family protein [Gammaproteobacteria bacterium]|nr:alkaline phosphatase family protein [Gammaproteobacteria bacterium]